MIKILLFSVFSWLPALANPTEQNLDFHDDINKGRCTAALEIKKVMFSHGWLESGGQKGPYPMTWEKLVGHQVEFSWEVEDSDPRTGDFRMETLKSVQRLVPVGTQDAFSLPVELVRQVRADATSILTSDQPDMPHGLVYQDVVVYAARWDKKWHRSKANIITPQWKFSEKSQKANYEKFLEKAAKNHVTDFAILTTSMESLPLSPLSSEPTEYAKDLAKFGITGITARIYLVPWEAPETGSDFLFMK